MGTASMYDLKHAIEVATQLELGEALVRCYEIFRHRKVVAEELIFCTDEKKRQCLLDDFKYCNEKLKLILGVWEENS